MAKTAILDKLVNYVFMTVLCVNRLELFPSNREFHQIVGIYSVWSSAEKDTGEQHFSHKDFLFQGFLKGHSKIHGGESDKYIAEDNGETIPPLAECISTIRSLIQELFDAIQEKTRSSSVPLKRPFISAWLGVKKLQEDMKPLISRHIKGSFGDWCMASLEGMLKTAGILCHIPKWKDTTYILSEEARAVNINYTFNEPVDPKILLSAESRYRGQYFCYLALVEIYGKGVVGFNYRGFEWLRNPATGRILEIDMPVLKFKVLFEYNDHKKHIHHKATVDDIKKTHERDAFKQAQCAKNGYKLVYIPLLESVTMENARAVVLNTIRDNDAPVPKKITIVISRKTNDQT